MNEDIYMTGEALLHRLLLIRTRGFSFAHGRFLKELASDENFVI